MGISEAAVAAVCQHHAFAHAVEIGEQGLAILLIDLRADGDLEHGIVAARAVTVLAHAAPAVLGLEMLLIAIVDQRVQALDRLGDHIAALAAVAAIRSAELNELLAAERHTAVP